MIEAFLKDEDVPEYLDIKMDDNLLSTLIESE